MEFEHLGVSLAFPLIFKEDVIGLLALGHKQSGAIFTEGDLDLLRTLTNQGAIAIANARAYRALEEANAEGSCWIPGSWICQWHTTRLLSCSPP
jgi:GAF domain-containing protein